MREIGSKLVIATHNPGKLREIAELLEPLGLECVSAAELDLPEPEESGVSFADNADLKAREAADLSGLPALADDSGLVVDALHGRPGIYSARWAEDEDGNRDWMRAMKRVWDEVEAAGPEAGHDAHFACALAIAWPNDGQVETFEGRVDGTLVWPPRGDKGFGYDPMFVAAGHERTFGEMDPPRQARDQPPRRCVQEIGGGATSRMRPFVPSAVEGPPKACLDFARHERNEYSLDLALYVHWPFCVSKCPYCDFNSHIRSAIDQDEWREALLADLAHEAALLPGRKLTSIFFGGGTPSLMEPRTVAALIESARRHWTAVEVVEITLEANPNSVESERFADIAAAGVNRLSLGLQSFDDHKLAFLGRAHSADEGLRALDTAQRCFERVSFDLIYALPEDDELGWALDLDRALDLGTTHLSLYQLTIEPGTRFATDVGAKRFVPLDEERSAALFELTQERTRSAALPAYEISNHARSGAESRHNLTYWRYGDYAGIGPGAHGRRCGMRTQRHRKPENFLAGLKRNGHGIAEEGRLSPRQRADEALVMGLRLAEGVDVGRIERLYSVESVDWHAVDRLVASGHLTRDDRRIRLTDSGRLLLDYILGVIAAGS